MLRFKLFDRGFESVYPVSDYRASRYLAMPTS
jgi:hypothetical protein